MGLKPITIYYTQCRYTDENLAYLRENLSIHELNSPYNTWEGQSYVWDNAEVLFCPLGHQAAATVLSRLLRLRAVVSNTTSTSHIDTDWCSHKGIEVCSLEGDTEFLETITSTAEHTLGLIHALHRRIPAAFDNVKEGVWHRWHWPAPKMLSRMTLGIIGMGRIGHMVYNRAYDLFQNILVTDLERQEYLLDDVLHTSDIITLHIDGRPENRNFVDADFLRQMRPGSLLINTSRGEHVNTEALLQALQNGHLAGAALDVLPDEYEASSTQANRDLLAYARTHDNLILTPHIAGSTLDAWHDTQRRVIDKALDVCRQKGELE